MSSDEEIDTGQPIAELKEHTLDAPDDLAGRVRRDINRRSLAADSLELSLTMMLKIVWEYTQSLLESLPGVTNREDDTNQDKEE